MKAYLSLALAFVLVLRRTCRMRRACGPLPAASAAPSICAASAAQDPIVLVNAFVTAMNRGAVDEALAMFTDDAEYTVAVQASKGKEQIRTFFEYMDGMRMRVVQSDCKLDGEAVICSQQRQDDSMAAFGFNDVRFKFAYGFRDGKIQKAIGTPDGPGWPAYSAVSKEAMAWMAANRAEEWKKISNAQGGLIRNGQTAPTVIKLVREYIKEKAQADAPAHVPIGRV